MPTLRQTTYPKNEQSLECKLRQLPITLREQMTTELRRKVMHDITSKLDKIRDLIRMVQQRVPLIKYTLPFLSGNFKEGSLIE